MPKQLVTKSKNPFAICWGLLLRRERENRSWEYIDIERLSGIKPDFYRNIEKANFNLHVSQALPLLNTFRNEILGDPFTLDGIISILSIISIMEAKGNEAKRQWEAEQTSSSADNYYSAIKSVALEFAGNSDRLETLFERYFAENLFEPRQNNKDIEAILETKGFVDDLESYIKNYNRYTEKSASPVVSKYANSFFDNIPSIYTDFFTETKKNLLGIPVKMLFSELQKWEKNNENRIHELYVLNTGKFNPTAISNLEEYHYSYLFNPKFEKARFLLVDNIRNEKKIKKEFEENLSTAYGRVQLNKPKNWSEGLAKIKFSVSKSLTSEIKELLTFKDDNKSEIVYECFWVFKFYNDTLVGFVANATETKNNKNEVRFVFDEGKNLFINDLQNKFPILKKMFD